MALCPSAVALQPPARTHAGGGNETSALAVAAPVPLGAVPTFTVESLTELQQRLEARDTALGWGASGGAASLSPTSSSFSSSESEGEGDSWAGAPPAGLDFLDALATLGVVQVGVGSVGVWGEGEAGLTSCCASVPLSLACHSDWLNQPAVPVLRCCPAHGWLCSATSSPPCLAPCRR